MSDYVKREPRTFIEISDDLNDLLTELNDKIVESIWARTADVAPVRHGRWMDMKGFWMCSECHKDTLNLFSYCPYCGAKMDEEK